MAIEVEQLSVVVRAETAGAEAGLARVGERAAGASGGLKSFLGNMLGIGAGIGGVMIATAGFEFLKTQLVDTVKAGMDAEATQAKTEAIIRSTGDAAHLSGAQVEALADHYMRLTGVSNETIQQGENILLTFRNISGNGGVFQATTQAALDMTSVMGTDLNSAMLQLGKALNDPLHGLTALQRVGVTFDASQKQLIKTYMAHGEIAKAQGIILQELQHEFKGAAETAGTTMAGKLKIAAAEMEHTREVVGQALLQPLGAVVTAAAPVLASLGEQIPAALQFLQQHFDQVKIVLASFAAVALYGVAPALGAVLFGEEGVVTAAAGLALSLAPFVLAALALAGIGLELKHLYDTSKPFHDAVNQLGAAVGVLAGVFKADLEAGLKRLAPYLQQAAAWLGPRLQQALAALTPQLVQAAQTVTKFATELSVRLGPAMSNVFGFIQGALKVLSVVWAAVWPGLSQVLQGVWQVISGVVKVAWSLVSGIIEVGLDLLSGNWKQAWTDLVNMFKGVWDGITDIARGAWNILVGGIKGLIGEVVGLFHGLADVLVGHSIIPDMINGIVSWFKGLPGKALSAVQALAGNLTGFFTGLAGKAAGWGQSLIQGLINGITGMAGNLAGALGNIAGGAVSTVKGLFGIHSPSAVFAEIGNNLSQGLVQGVRAVDVAGAVAAHLSSIPATVSTTLGVGVSGGGGAASPVAVGAQVAAGAFNLAVPSGPSPLAGLGGPDVVQHLHIYLDGKVIAENTIRRLPNIVRIGTGIKAW